VTVTGNRGDGTGAQDLLVDLPVRTVPLRPDQNAVLHRRGDVVHRIIGKLASGAVPGVIIRDLVIGLKNV
jgi:hypothetical protein